MSSSSFPAKDLSQQQQPQPQRTVDEEDKRRRFITILQGTFIIFSGAALSYAGFRHGLQKQLELAKEEEKIAVDPLKKGPSGIPAKQLALRALGRSSAVAYVVASVAGVGLSYWVESRQKPINKEDNDRELKALWKELGVDHEVNAPASYEEYGTSSSSSASLSSPESKNKQ